MTVTNSPDLPLLRSIHRGWEPLTHFTVSFARIAARSALCAIICLMASAVHADELFDEKELSEVAEVMQTGTCDEVCKTANWDIQSVAIPSGAEDKVDRGDSIYFVSGNSKSTCGAGQCVEAYLLRTSTQLIHVWSNLDSAASRPLTAEDIPFKGSWGKLAKVDLQTNRPDADGSEPTAKDIVGQDAVWKGKLDFECDLNSGYSNWRGCMSRNGIPEQTLAFSDRLVESKDFGIPGIITDLFELGQVDVAKVAFPGIADPDVRGELKYGMDVRSVLVNGSDVIMDPSQWMSDFDASGGGFNNALDSYPNAIASRVYRVNNHRKLPGGVDRFVIAIGLRDACATCELVGLKIGFLDFHNGEVVRFSDVAASGLPDFIISEEKSIRHKLAENALRRQRRDFSLQFILNIQGYSAGAMDGLIGPQTINALAEFQQERCLPEEKHLSHEAITWLVDGMDSFDFAPDPPCLDPAVVASHKLESSENVSSTFEGPVDNEKSVLDIFAAPEVAPDSLENEVAIDANDASVSKAERVVIDYNGLTPDGRIQLAAEAVSSVGGEGSYFASQRYTAPRGMNEFELNRKVELINGFIDNAPTLWRSNDTVAIHTKFKIKLFRYDFNKASYLAFAPNSLEPFEGQFMDGVYSNSVGVGLVFDTDDTMNFVLDGQYDGYIKTTENGFSPKYGGFEMVYFKVDPASAEALMKASAGGMITFDGECELYADEGAYANARTKCEYRNGTLSASGISVNFIPY